MQTVPEVLWKAKSSTAKMLRKLPHPAGEVPQVVSPLKFAHAPLAFERAPPLLGEHTNEILRELENSPPAPRALTDMSRLHLPSLDEMTPDQRAVHDEIVSGIRGRLIGPLRAVIHSPDLARRWSQLGEYLRFSTACRKSSTSSPLLSQDGTGTPRSSFSSRPKRRGQQASIPHASRRSVPASRRPLQMSPQRNSTSLRARCCRPERSMIVARRGRGALGLTRCGRAHGLIGYYSMVAMTLNAHEIRCPMARCRHCTRRARAASRRCRHAKSKKQGQRMVESYECMKLDVADFVATVRLARPPVNAQNRRFREEMIACSTRSAIAPTCARWSHGRGQDVFGRRRSQGAPRPE